MQADMECEKVHMKMEGKMAEPLTKLDPKLYRKYVTNEKGITVLYVELEKALYGMLQVALLLWRNVSSSLQDWGSGINPYDWCVSNKTVNGKQMTVAWHVDDLNISHENGHSGHPDQQNQ